MCAFSIFCNWIDKYSLFSFLWQEWWDVDDMNLLYVDQLPSDIQKWDNKACSKSQYCGFDIPGRLVAGLNKISIVKSYSTLKEIE